MIEDIRFTIHPDDPRVAIIDSIEDFQLWHARRNFGIHGIICREPPASLPAMAEAAQHVARASLQPEYGFTRLDEDDYPEARAHKFMINPFSREKTAQRMQSAGLDEVTQAVTMRLGDQFCSVTMADGFVNVESPTKNGPVRTCAALLRVNDSTIGQFHSHGMPFMNVSFAAASMVCQAPDGTKYSPGVGEPMLFDSAIYHKSPTFRDSWKVQPRSTLIFM